MQGSPDTHESTEYSVLLVGLAPVGAGRGGDSVIYGGAISRVVFVVGVSRARIVAAFADGRGPNLQNRSIRCSGTRQGFHELGHPQRQARLAIS